MTLRRLVSAKIPEKRSGRVRTRHGQCAAALYCPDDCPGLVHGRDAPHRHRQSLRAWNLERAPKAPFPLETDRKRTGLGPGRAARVLRHIAPETAPGFNVTPPVVGACVLWSTPGLHSREGG